MRRSVRMSGRMLESLVLLASALLSACGQPKIVFTSPEDASRLWVDEDNPVEVKIEVEGLSFPKDGSLGLFVNGRDTQQRLSQPPFVIKFADVDDGLYHIAAFHFDRNGVMQEQYSAHASFMTRRSYDSMEHEGYHVSAEGPRADGSLRNMPGLQEWDYGTVSWSEGQEEEKESEARRFMRKRWTHRLSTEEMMRGSDILRAYADFHHQVMSNQSLWKANNFLIYRTMDRGLGNQLESLVAAFAMALLSNRVFLVDSTTIHHLFSPPPALAWHYDRVADNMDHDWIYSRSKLLDLRFLNPLEFPKLLCKELGEAYQQQMLFIFSDQYFLPALQHNPRYKSILRDWFGTDLFGTLARYLLRPKEYLVQQAVSFYKENLQSSYSLGLQVRTATMAAHDMKMLVEGMDAFAWKDWINSFWKCALLAGHEEEGGGPGGGGEGGSTAYFIATDHNRVKGMADEVFGNGSRWYKQEVTRSTIQGHATALIDLLVLSLCDDLVTTTMSTFGYVPSALASKAPLVVSYQSTCLREISAQPCFHKWSYVFEAECYDPLKMISPEVRFCGIYSPPERLAEGVM